MKKYSMPWHLDVLLLPLFSGATLAYSSRFFRCMRTKSRFLFWQWKQAHDSQRNIHQRSGVELILGFGAAMSCWAHFFEIAHWWPESFSWQFDSLREALRCILPKASLGKMSEPNFCWDRSWGQTSIPWEINEIMGHQVDRLPTVQLEHPLVRYGQTGQW